MRAYCVFIHYCFLGTAWEQQIENAGLRYRVQTCSFLDIFVLCWFLAQIVVFIDNCVCYIFFLF